MKTKECYHKFKVESGTATTGESRHLRTVYNLEFKCRNCGANVHISTHKVKAKNGLILMGYMESILNELP